MKNQNLISYFFISFIISGAYFFEYINYSIFTYTGMFYRKSEVLFSFSFLHFFITFCIYIYFKIIKLKIFKRFYNFFDQIFIATIFFLLLRVFVKSTSYPGLIFFFQSNFNLGTKIEEKIMICLFILLFIFLIQKVLSRKYNLINFYKIYGFFLMLTILFHLIFNSIFQDKNLIFQNMIETKKNFLNRKKVIFLVFDTFDYEQSFQQEKFKLKNTEILKKKSLFFENAYPPASKTLHVLPSLLTGEMPTKFFITGEFKKLEFNNTKNKRIIFNYRNSIFSELEKKTNLKKENFYITGRYHPICNIFIEIKCLNFTAEHDFQTRVKWHHGLSRFCETISEFLKPLKNYDYCRTNILTLENQNVSAYSETKYLHENIKSLINDNANFIFGHFLPPKRKGDVYYGKYFLNEKNFLYKNKENISAIHRGFAQNLLFTDQLIDEVLRNLKKIDDDYMLIITGDTSYYENENENISKRVPLIIYLKDKDKGFTESKIYNTVNLREIIIDFFNNKINSYNLISEHVSRVKSHYPLKR